MLNEVHLIHNVEPQKCQDLKKEKNAWLEKAKHTHAQKLKYRMNFNHFREAVRPSGQ